MVENTENFRSKSTELFKVAQQLFCQEIERCDGKARFTTDNWKRSDSDTADGGGGITKILRHGAVFEQAGVNFSSVSGMLPVDMAEKLTGKKTPLPFFATGISLVVHPYSPLVPTTHANLRYLEVDGEAWFGGGSDLTPYYLFEEDAVHFHQSIKEVCDKYNPEYFPKFKKWCDEYFYLPHRQEARGIGGIFFDYCGKDAPTTLAQYFAFVESLAHSLAHFYLPIVEKRKDLSFTPEQKQFQLMRRGRYVEFNLIYDRGTLFGLKTKGRTESILMSLPPEVRWEYNFVAQPGSAEAKLIAVLQQPREWIR